MNKENKICKNCKYHYIEEISFDYPQSCCNFTSPNHTTEERLNCDKFEYSEDYITLLQNQLQQKEEIIKEAREYINKNKRLSMFNDGKKPEEEWLYDLECDADDLLQILDKGE